MSEQDKDTIRAYYDAIDSREVDKIASLCTPDATFQFGGAPAISLAQFTAMTSGFGAGSSRHVIRELVAEGDKIACLVDVVAKTPKGEGFMKALTLFTFSGGRIANELVIVDRGMPGA
jgi:hypothetical protein